MADVTDRRNLLFADMIAEVARALDKIPARIRNAAPTAVPAASILIKSVVDYVDHHEALEVLHGYLSTTRAASQARAENLLGQLKDFKEISGNSKALIGAAQCPEIADGSLIDCVKGCIRQSANRALGAGFAISLIGLLLEAGRLWAFWEEICEAGVFVKNGFNEKKKLIEAELDKLPAEIAKFAEGVEQSHFQNMNDQQRLRFHVRKTKERDSLRKSIDNIEKAIGNLEGDVNGRIQKLHSYCSASNPAALGQVLQGTSVGINLTLFGAAANPILAIATGVAMLGHFAAAGTGLWLKRSAKATMVELGEKLGEIKQLRDMVAKHQEELERVFDEFNENIIK